MIRAESSFTVDDRDMTPVDWEGGAMSRARFTKTFTGDLVGSSVVEAAMLMAANDGPVAYVGLERIEGALHGRTGSFVLLHAATGHRGEQTGSWTIVSGSGGGELTGIQGSGTITEEHEFTLDYEIEG
ncbi:MAG TPA: DUF3224 domain-containing protein [Cryptosporangiaceae bacterium]|nr:DUF3224 domain-containing protein [Cryptosporangiaceae bacterium]